MSDFGDLRGQLAEKRAGRDEAALTLATAREQLRDAKTELAERERLATQRDRGQLAELEQRVAALGEEVDGRRGDLAGLDEDVSGLLGKLVELADPTRQLSELDDATPILLFPVRLEVRFHTATPPRREAAAIAAPPHQLWIRIYPDDCQIDSFEELLTKTEIENAREFWASMWRAGGVEAQERGAWRSLVGGSGSGRAAYVVQQYRPDNLAQKPAKVDPQDVVLVIVPEIDLTDAEQDAAFAYYTEVWKADGDTARVDTARAALETAVGGQARADEIREKFKPEATGQEPPKPYTRDEVRVSCAVLKLPAAPPTKTTAWTQAPRAIALPDRFVAVLQNGGAEVKRAVGNPIPDRLAVGPDPSLPPNEQIKMDGDDLVLNDDLRWLADFERAVEVGMGIKVDLSPAEAAAGFDRLLVLGVRISADEAQSRDLLSTLVAHHHASTHGFGLVPQGSPTNNTGSEGAAHTWADDPDASYDVVFKGKDAYAENDDPFERRDGQWLAEALGIDDALLKVVPNAAGRDQGEARAMNVALWPATLGYELEEMLPPLFQHDLAPTRAFFTRYVSGRGPLPGVRVGNQPYGVFPAMAFSRYRALAKRGREGGPAYLQRLHTLLARVDGDWRGMAASVAHVGHAGDPHQTLLDVVGLHSGSVEYHQRYAESFDQLYNKLVLELGPFWGGLLAAHLKTRSRDLLTRLGADPNAQPAILEKFFYGESALLKGPVVDDVPLSETRPVRTYSADGKNYVEWLATSPLETIRSQDFGGKPAPSALLYLMLRHAMMLGNWDAGIRFLEVRGLVDSAVVRREPPFVHVQAAKESESKFRHLYQAYPEVTGDQTTTLGEYVLLPSILAGATETEDLREVVAALELLKDAPTARLERVFADHVDCCSYRLDAWKTGLTATRLDEMRARGRQKVQASYLGAFGWLENLRARTDALSPVELGQELAGVFERPQDAPLRHDPANAGYVHAPSLNHAAAAAILKNAYRVNATPQNPDADAVNLSSKRVRGAMSILEGMRSGQTLGALLGYRFERGLHDDHGLAEVDKFIYPLRQAFPLVANQLKSTTPDDPTDITLLEARNVVDGLQLAMRVREPGHASYPFGFPSGTGAGQLPPASSQEQTAIDAVADELANLHDAVADLVLAESVYQVVLGNFDRAAAVMNAFSEGSHPPETFVVDTPRTGLALTHRVALHLDAAADPTVSPSAVPMTPRAEAEAPLNLWLAGRMPDPADVVVRVRYSSPVLAAEQNVTLTLETLGLQPIELLYLVNLDLEQAMSELDDRIVQEIRYGPDAHPDIAITIDYTEHVAGKVTIFELAALVRSLRTAVLKSRPVGPADMAMPLVATSAEEVWDADELAARVNAAIATLKLRRDELVALETDASDLDAYAKKVSEAFLRTALHGLPQVGVGGIHADIRAIYDAIVAKSKELVARWKDRQTEFTTLLSTYGGLATDAERFALLYRAEGLVSSHPTPNPPANVGTYKTQVEATKGQFDTVLGQFDDLSSFAGTKLVDFAAAADALVAAAAVHDATPFDIDDQKNAITSLRATLVTRVTSAADDLTKRIDDATTSVGAAAGASSSRARVEQLVTQGRRVLGDEMTLVPRFRLDDARGLEFAQAWSGSAALLTDLEAAGRKFPVDDWLYGLARVREKLNAWENVAVLSEAFGSARLDLAPVQLPRQPNDRWTALEFDTSTASGDRLLYTTHFATAFDRTADQCGLLLDEWPETVPGTDIVSGLTFHFDRPGSQPPQAMLLAVPPALTGSWQWDDLVATLNETLEAAKSRAVEPAQVDGSSYAQLLPATLMAVTLYMITIATNLAENNRIYEVIRR